MPALNTRNMKHHPFLPMGVNPSFGDRDNPVERGANTCRKQLSSEGFGRTDHTAYLTELEPACAAAELDQHVIATGAHDAKRFAPTQAV